MEPSPVEMFTIRGGSRDGDGGLVRDFCKKGKKALVTRKGPVALVSKAERICWRRGGVRDAVPALLTSMSSFP